tara:strand:+ start:371 stop:577 length:207 start_codon:yes stop_codon:yes gene_type:complete
VKVRTAKDTSNGTGKNRQNKGDQELPERGPDAEWGGVNGADKHYRQHSGAATHNRRHKSSTIRDLRWD